MTDYPGPSANVNLPRYSVEQMTEAMKVILHEMRGFDARLSTLEAGLGDPTAHKKQCSSKPFSGNVFRGGYFPVGRNSPVDTPYLRVRYPARCLRYALFASH
ncbi:hypothetical protein ACFXPS_15105 [Nocardia sp. NPDC059091]|uniref:hypothetical protein n=1 Tax=unclassified Nocardia TaxID=2637762 RepID=UPI003678BBEC